MRKHRLTPFTGISLFLLCLLQQSSATELAQQHYVSTPYPAKKVHVLSNGIDSPAHEDVSQLFDGDRQSKFLVRSNNVEIIFSTETAINVSQYQLVSANDAPGRDPQTWRLEGSTDQKVWQLIDAQQAQTFKQRNSANSYHTNSSNKFNYFRITFAHQSRSSFGDNYLQLSEVILFSDDQAPITEFSVSSQVINPQQQVQFWDHSKNHPTKWHWEFEHGVPATSNEPSPRVTFTQPGAHRVTLTTFNAYGQDQQSQARFIKVVDLSQPWLGFEYPKVILSHQDTSSAGYQRVVRLMPNIEQVINDISLKVNQHLYKNFAQSPNFDQVVFSLQYSDTLASRGGSGSTMLLTFSTKYVEQRLADKSDEEVLYELEGVFWHELVHGYQQHLTAQNYSPGSPYHAYIEGMADLVRIKAGYHKTRQPIPSENWLGGYTNTGFFLHWLEQHYQANLTYLLNQSPLETNQWQFDVAIENIVGAPLETLWQRYQAALGTTGT